MRPVRRTYRSRPFRASSNDAPNVTLKTRDRVMKVATALHYHPNVVAQAWSGRRSYLLGLFYENPSLN